MGDKKSDFLKTGLTSEEAQKRLEKFGPNELEKKKDFSSLKLFFSQFKSPLVYILVFAGIVTLFLRDFTDSTVIFAAVFLNTILGFYQERKAQKGLAALRSLLAPKAKVIRDDKQQEIEATEVVPGDLVVLTIGTCVPADGFLIEATDFSVNEAILTGESMPVSKKASKKATKARKENTVFMGTTVVAGIAKMEVTKIGMETEMGKIGKSLKEVEEEETPLQVQLNKLAKILALVVGVITLIIFLLGSFFGYELIEIFTTSVAVAVAAIPEGLVVTLTVILALGMQRILKRKAIVRKLIAAETLGSVSVICADKTGTLTEGEMKVVKDDFTNKELGVKAAILCNDMRDPLEVAMWQWALQRKADPKILQEKNPRLDEVPFSPQYKYIATLHPNLLFISGAPEVILSRCELKNTELKEWQKKLDDYGSKGYRLVGFGYKRIQGERKKIKKEDLKNCQWLGLLVYEDPVREGVKPALEECQKAGIKVKVITGDYASTAIAVLKQLDFQIEPKTQVIKGEELEKLSEKELAKKVNETILFARTNPEQKLKIVQALKENGEVVAMTGDGVNDAPALKQADIGIVVGEASDVAKEIADVVLLDSNFSTIVHAVEEGRTIFENIKKVVLYLLSDSFTEIILIGGSILMRLPLPLTAAQILWINLVEDSLPAVALAFEPEEKEVMRELPRPRGAPILDLELKIIIFIIGISTDLLLFVLFYWLNRGFLHLSYVQTVMFVALGINSLFYVFACRSLRKPIFKYNPFGNRFLTLSVLLGFFLLGMVVYLPPLQVLFKTHPLGITEWALLFGIGFFNLFAIESTKWFFILRKARNRIKAE
ncbi:HAD-IC family P-type ATPase [Patescibacteria group bacterium]|nr:HAD-IC family P-type ATPase [Patescibacteria group bacterium]